jgi:putative ABC transport system substrate-binding protein
VNAQTIGKEKFKNIVLTCLLLALFLPAIADAQTSTGNVFRIGVLSAGYASGYERNIDPFREGLRELGYIEGKTILFEVRHADGHLDRLPQLADELVRLNVDAIFVTGNQAAAAAKRATNKIPIVVGGAGDLVGTGLVASLANPGGNLTGSTRMSTELGGKRIELLKDVIPKVSRVAVILSTRQDRDELKQLENAARELEVKIQPIEVRDPSQFQSTYGAMTKQHAEAVVIFHSGFTYSRRAQLLSLAVNHRLPSLCEQSGWTDNGCLISYGPDQSHLARRAAALVDKILKGTRPAEIPVEQPTKFELIINLKTAKQIGLTIPPNVLARADRVIR